MFDNWIRLDFYSIGKDIGDVAFTGYAYFKRRPGYIVNDQDEFALDLG